MIDLSCLLFILLIGVPYVGVLSIVVFAAYFRAKLRFHQVVLEQLKQEEVR